MMGNNLDALKTARSISKQLTANKQHLPKTNDRQNDVNLPRKRPNSELAGSDYGVTRYTQFSSAACGSEYLKETSSRLSMMNGSRKHVGLATVVDNTSSDWNDNSFVYHSPGKSNTGAQEIRLKNYSPKAKSEKRTAIDQSTKSRNNKKCPIVVDLTLDDSDDDDDNGVGSGSTGIDGNCKVGSVSGEVGCTGSRDYRISVDGSSVGANGGSSDDSDGVVIIGCGSKVGISSGSSRDGGGGSSSSKVGVSSVSSRVGGSGSVVDVVSGGSKIGGSSGDRGIGISGTRSEVNEGSSKVCVSSGGNRVGDSVISEVVGGGGSRVGGSRVGGSRVGGSVVGEGGDDSISQDQPDTLPKILAAYSLKSGYPSIPDTELCNILSQRAKENVVKQNGIVVNGSAAIPTKGPNLSMVTEPPLKNGIMPQPKNDVISSNNQSPCESTSIAYNRNDVMNDVTNLRNEDSTKKLEHTQMVFSNWSFKHDSNLDSMRRDQGGAASPTDTGDQVIITKVVTSTEKSYERKHHPRKTPVEVRKLYFQEKEMPSTVCESDVLKRKRKADSICKNKNVERPEKRTLEETIASLNGNINGTPWSFTMKPDNCYRENKILNLKARLAEQQEAVEKLRAKEKNVSTPQNGVKRVLVVRIPDLKEKLGIQSEKKQSFRVIDEKDSFENLGPGNKRKRKPIPRKVSREADYNSCYQLQRRTRTRIQKEKIKQRFPRRARGRSNSPVVRKVDKLVPVVSKDLWHREMEKVEAELASSNRAMDKTAFLLFLGLKKVAAS